MEHDMECSICMQLLLDPVVASCGHDFCRACLVSWADTLPEGKSVACPLCRSELASCAEVVKTFGVCVRLKRMLESLYPDKVAQRRKDRQQQDEARLSKSQRSAAQQQLLQLRQGRARYLRARRTRLGDGAPMEASTAGPSASGSGAPAGAVRLTMASPAAGGVRQVRVGAAHDAAASAVVAVGASLLPWAPHSNAHPSLVPLVSGDGAGNGTDGLQWQAPSTVTFTMGWWEAPVKKSERRRRQQQRLLLLQQPGRARHGAAPALPVAH